MEENILKIEDNTRPRVGNFHIRPFHDLNIELCLNIDFGFQSELYTTGQYEYEEFMIAKRLFNDYALKVHRLLLD